MNTKSDKELVSNRRAYHDYQILHTYEAGVSLSGAEVKSLKNHGGSLQDSYVSIEKNEAFLVNCSIAPYSHASAFNLPEKRKRKLLLNKLEIAKLIRQTQEKGMAIVPLAIYLKKRWIKVKIGVAKGKKAYDKRQSIKEKEQKRAIQRAVKEQSS
ncbi:MAG: SsrA-binding protein SmpB [Chlamydiota bacterium]|jgi:SsrA-binding protein